MSSLPTPLQTPAWELRSRSGLEGLSFVEQRPLPTVKDDEILVKIHAASLNYRDLLIAKGGPGLALSKTDVVPGSDGAGTVVAVGAKVDAFRVGDAVCTHLTYRLPDGEHPSFDDIGAGLGHGVDGSLSEYGVFHETCLVKMPGNLSFLEAATLPCSALTAWNALFGLESKAPKAGDTVVVQGTGGVSIAALQFCLAAGASVVATTSTVEKAERLTSMGARHVINYRDTPDWGEKVKALTPDGKGAHIVVDVGGASTLRQSLKAVRIDGLIAAAGALRDAAPGAQVPTILDCVFFPCAARGVLLGSRSQFRDMNRFIETHGIKPVLDENIFDLKQVKEAYRYLTEQKHFSKIVIRIS